MSVDKYNRHRVLTLLEQATRTANTVGPKVNTTVQAGAGRGDWWGFQSATAVIQATGVTTGPITPQLMGSVDKGVSWYPIPVTPAWVALTTVTNTHNQSAQVLGPLPPDIRMDMLSGAVDYAAKSFLIGRT